jgi:predicted SnoaL-like aldol condensation-catalyzing enzyme
MSNRQIISDYMRAVFVERDLAKAESFFGPTKTEHNPGMPNGHDVIRAFITNAPKDLTYEQGLIAETGDHVMVHGRYTGWEGKTMITVDIFRLEDGKVVEHGPGGYRFGDFWKLGLIVMAWTLIVTVVVIPLYWKF